MLYTHQLTCLRENFENLMHEELDLYDDKIPPEAFERIWVSFMMLKRENFSQDENFKVYEIRMDGRDVRILSR